MTLKTAIFSVLQHQSVYCLQDVVGGVWIPQDACVDAGKVK